MNGTSWWQSRLRQLGWGGAAGLPVDLQGHPAKDPRFLPRWHVWILPETLGKDCTTVLCKTTRKMKDSEDGSSRMHRLNNGYQSLLRGTYWLNLSLLFPCDLDILQQFRRQRDHLFLGATGKVTQGRRGALHSETRAGIMALPKTGCHRLCDSGYVTVPQFPYLQMGIMMQGDCEDKWDNTCAPALLRAWIERLTQLNSDSPSHQQRRRPHCRGS